MNTPVSPTPAPGLRLRSKLCLLALATLGTLAMFLLPRKEQPPTPTWLTLERSQLETRNGRSHRPGEAVPFTGIVTDHLKDGTLVVQSDMVDGQLHGESTGWSTNGVRELHEEFQLGLPHGTRTTWHPNGQKKSEGQLVAGKQHGSYRQWDEAGTLAAEAGFEDGKPHGISRAWHSDGSLKAEVLMRHGEVEARHVYPVGTRWESALLAATAPATAPSTGTAQTK